VGRENDSQVISAINIGLALEDMAVAPIVYEKATEKNMGVWLDL
jgi:ornithine cyclodeaminase/alanine dehydrogenase